MATDDGLRYVDSDGHILEHPTAMPEYAPAEYRDRIWHIETDEAGEEWLVYQGNRTPANGMAAAGVAGASDEDRARAFRGEMRYTETRPAAWNAKARLQDMDQDHIDLAVLYPDDAARAPERARRRLRRGAGPRLQRLVLRPRLRGRGTPVRGRRGASHARAGRRRAGGGGDPSGGHPARHGVGVHAPEPGDRLAAVQRPGLRPTLAGGFRHRAADRAAPVPRRRPARHVHGPAPEPAPQARRPVRRRLRPRAPTEQRRAPGAPRATPDQHLHPGRSRTRST